MRAAFEELRERSLLPVNQIDEDDVRAEIDRRLIVDVLGWTRAYALRMGR